MSDAFSIQIVNLCKSFGQRTVLDVDRLELSADRACALVGPNGSGKSTLLRMLAGVDAPTSGAIDVVGKDRNDVRVGYMPQKSYVFGFSVFKNVALALDGQGLSSEEVTNRVDEALRAVGMKDFADERGSGLSGGEAQRVALARMFVRDLDVLLLDEPTASMDIAGTLLVEAALARYRERTGCLLVVATHAPSQARRIAEKAVMLSAGRVVECGSVNQVLSAPTSEEGRAFLSYWAV